MSFRFGGTTSAVGTHSISKPPNYPAPQRHQHPQTGKPEHKKPTAVWAHTLQKVIVCEFAPVIRVLIGCSNPNGSHQQKFFTQSPQSQCTVSYYQHAAFKQELRADSVTPTFKQTASLLALLTHSHKHQTLPINCRKCNRTATCANNLINNSQNMLLCNKICQLVETKRLSQSHSGSSSHGICSVSRSIFFQLQLPNDLRTSEQLLQTRRQA